MIFLVLGLLAMLDLATAVDVTVSAYFAATLVTIALGLVIGAWFGRARWLIALGLVTAAALGVATVAESHGPVRGIESVVWSPASYEELAVRYSHRFGPALLDLSEIDFTGRDAQVTASVELGQLRVLLPPDVDLEATVEVKTGDARVLDTAWSGLEQPTRTITDLGRDGRGGGKLKLFLYVNAGNAEVER